MAWAEALPVLVELARHGFSLDALTMVLTMVEDGFTVLIMRKITRRSRREGGSPVVLVGTAASLEATPARTIGQRGCVRKATSGAAAENKLTSAASKQR